MPQWLKNPVHLFSDMKIPASKLRRTNTSFSWTSVCLYIMLIRAFSWNANDTGSKNSKSKSRKMTLIWRLLQIINTCSKLRVKTLWYSLTCFTPLQPLISLTDKNILRLLRKMFFEYKQSRNLSAWKYNYSSVGFRIIFHEIFKYIQLLKLPFKRTSRDGLNKKSKLDIPLELDTLHIPSSLKK